MHRPFLFLCTVKIFSAFIILSLFTLSCIAQQPDSVTVMGQLQGNCSFSKIYIKEFSITAGQSYYAEANAYGFFKVKIAVYGPQQFTLTAGKLRYDFIITPAQTEYRFTITCRNDGDFNIKLEDSKENDAFDLLGKIERTLVNNCADIVAHIRNADSLYTALQNLCLAQNYNLQQLSNNFPNTFTAAILAPACSLPVNLQRQNYPDSFIYYGLKNGAWNNVRLYHTDFPLSFIVLAKTLFARKSEVEKDRMVYDLLSYGPGNNDAAKLYQQCLSEYLFYQLEENRLRAFCKWAEENPDRIQSEVLKAKLRGMKKVLPGSDFINVSLKDSGGVGRALVSTVNSHAYTLVLFWSPDCEHCIAEMPDLISFYKKYQAKGVEVYAIAIDSQADKWKSFISTKTAGWVNVRDEEGKGGNVASDYMVNYTPTLVLINKAGKIQSRFGSLAWIETILRENGME